MENKLNMKQAPPLSGIWERITTFGRMIKFSHTVFALPFALAAVVLANRTHPLTPWRFLWLLAAMVGARSAAMGFNRIADARLDKKNPRTANREIPAGKLSPGTAVILVILISGLFIFAASMFSKLCLYLSVPVLLLLFSYSYTKRFTVLCHLYLGLTISLAPLGTWIALTGGFDWPIVLLSLALMAYIAGFDILYSCQDIAFDRKEGLFSIPVRFGPARALALAKGLHGASLVFFVLIAFPFQMGPVYLGAVGVIALLMFIEHRLVKPDDLSRINIAFFHMNSLISLTLFIGVLADELARHLS
jgi:4-hydroxybenzoate polyprenyltransferase